MADSIKPKNHNDVTCRDLILYGDISTSTVSEIAKSIVNINRFDQHTARRLKTEDVEYAPDPINIWVSSYGGSIYSMLSLVNHIKSSKTPVHTHVDGFAMSAACIIAMTGVRRYAYRYSRFMIHQGWTLTFGKFDEIDEQVAENRCLENIMLEIMVSNSKLKKKQLLNLFKTRRDWFLTAEEALQNGMIDEIL